MSSQFDFALALSIVKSKPRNVSTQDYIASLRRQITLQPGTYHRYIDCKAVWYTLQQQTKDQLDLEQNRTFALEKENGDLKARIAALENESDCVVGSSTKRRRTEQCGSPPKKIKPPRPSDTPDPLSLGLDFDVMRGSQPGLTALRSMHKLHKMMQGAMYSVNPTPMSDTINDTARALSHIIEGLPDQLRNTKQRAGLSEDELTATLIAVSRIYMTLLHALKRLCDLPKSESVIGNTVYHCVETFNSIFTTMEAVATNEAKTTSSPDPPPSKSTKAKQTTSATNRHLLHGLTNLVRSLIDSLDTELPPHTSLLEGLLYLLLASLAETIHLITFSAPANPLDISQEILTLPIPPEQNDEKRLDPARLLERRAMLTEAPYKLSILKKCLVAAPEAWKRRMPEGLVGKYYLTPFALRRLQRTLVGCIFGPSPASGTRGEGVEGDVLRMPRLRDPVTIPEEVTRTEMGREKGLERAGDWFEGELWATVGWEILGVEEEL